MNGEVMTGNRRGASARMAFTDKTNPNRPAAAAGEPYRETRGETRSIPDRCDPRHPQRPLNDAQRELVTQYMPMARALAARLKGPQMRRDELEAEAYAALVDAARTFDPDRGVNFAVHARPRITGALSDYRRFLFHANWRRERGTPPVFQRLSKTDDLHGWVIGKEPGEPLGREFELSEAVVSIIRVLTRPQADACRLLYFEGKSCAEAAEVMGCTKGYVSRLHADALVQLRHHREALAV